MVANALFFVFVDELSEVEAREADVVVALALDLETALGVHAVPVVVVDRAVLVVEDREGLPDHVLEALFLLLGDRRRHQLVHRVRTPRQIFKVFNDEALFNENAQENLDQQIRNVDVFEERPAPDVHSLHQSQETHEFVGAGSSGFRDPVFVFF